MIYGCFNVGDLSENSHARLGVLKQFMSFNESEHQYIDASHFHGGFIRSNLNPATYDDYFYLDNEHENMVLFSGHIYNREELISSLNLDEIKCHNPELIYRAFRKHGVDFVKKLNGDFAIAIYQSAINKFILFRDHVGIRPLAYTIKDETIWFSSDTVSLCRVFHSPDEKMNSKALLKDFKFIDHTQTPNKNVKKLLPGHYLEFTPVGKVLIQKYWYPEKIRIDRSMCREKMLNEMKQLLDKAVSSRCDKRYHAATHLSGGLDSGIVAALAREAYSHQSAFYGYSWSPEGDSEEALKFDERILVMDQCKLNNIKPVFIKIDTSDYLNYSSEIIKHSDFFEENKVLEEAKKQNINLIFSGHGGDEFISKSHRGIDTDLLLNLQWTSFFRRNPLNRPKQFLCRILYEIIMPFFGFLSFPVKKKIKSDSQYVKEAFKEPDKKSIRNFYFYKSRRELHLGFLYCYYLPERMEDWFVNGARYGIEYRYPLLDKDIIEYVLKIRSKLLFKGEYSRIILREISKGILPESVRWKKSGSDPVAHYFAKKHVSDSSLEFANEIEAFKKNPDLDFIDFDKISTDIEKFRKNRDNETNEVLLLTIFNVKLLNEFIKAYRE